MKRKKTLNLKDIIDILAETDIKTVPDLNHDGDDCYGLAEYDARLVSLQEGMSIQQRKYVLIHELFHMSDYLRGFDTDEEDTDERTNNLYRKLYGCDFEMM